MSLEIRNERDDLRLRVKELEWQVTQQATTISQLIKALKESSKQHHTWCPLIADWPRGAKPCICPKSIADAALASIPKEKP
jgi:hypothetical protein